MSSMHTQAEDHRVTSERSTPKRRRPKQVTVHHLDGRCTEVDDTIFVIEDFPRFHGGYALALFGVRRIHWFRLDDVARLTISPRPVDFPAQS